MIETGQETVCNEEQMVGDGREWSGNVQEIAGKRPWSGFKWQCNGQEIVSKWPRNPQ